MSDIELRSILFDSVVEVLLAEQDFRRRVNDVAHDIVQSALSRFASAGLELRRATDAA